MPQEHHTTAATPSAYAVAGAQPSPAALAVLVVLAAVFHSLLICHLCDWSMDRPAGTLIKVQDVEPCCVRGSIRLTAQGVTASAHAWSACAG
jgi:hypothetical protein